MSDDFETFIVFAISFWSIYFIIRLIIEGLF